MLAVTKLIFYHTSRYFIIDRGEICSRSLLLGLSSANVAKRVWCVALVLHDAQHLCGAVLHSVVFWYSERRGSARRSAPP